MGNGRIARQVRFPRCAVCGHRVDNEPMTTIGAGPRGGRLLCCVTCAAEAEQQESET